MDAINSLSNLIFDIIGAAFLSGAFLAIAYALIIMVFAAFLTIYFESYLVRSLGLLGLAGITYLMLPLAEIGVFVLGLPGSQSVLADLYLRGLIFEFIGAFFILILFESDLTEDNRTFSPLAAFTLIASGIAIAGLPFTWFERQLGIEIAVMLIGAFLVTMVLKREWWWDTRGKYLASAKMDKDMLRYTEAGFAENLPNADAQIKVTGRTEGEVDLKIQKMKATMTILGESDYREDSKTGMYSKYVAAKFLTVLEQQKLQSEQVAINVRGSVELTRASVQRLEELFSVQDHKERSSPFKGEIQMEVLANLPQDSFGERLFLHFRDLAMSWRNASQQAQEQIKTTDDPRKRAYLEAVARANHQASAQLVQKLDEFHV